MGGIILSRSDTMIDVHTHIMPNVDDGAKSLEESLKLLNGLSQTGVTHVFLTPHVAKKRGYFETKETFTDHFNALCDAAKAIPIKLLLGSEVDESDDLIDVLSTAHTMNESNFVLIDFGMRKCDIEDVVYECQIKGYKVIVAHPERYFYTSMDVLRRLKKQGAYFQVSAPHLIKLGHKDAQKKAKQLLNENLIDFIGSDIHRDGIVMNAMEKAYKVIEKKKGQAVADALCYLNAKKYLVDKT
jgi:protein-tyrosine phosphatase